MKTKVLIRIAALGGILYVVLQICGQMLIQVGGAEPAFNAGHEEIVAFFDARTRELATTGSFLSLLAFIPFLFFLGAFWQRLKTAEGNSSWLSAVVLGSGLLIVGTQIVSGTGWTTLFFRMDTANIPELTRFQFDFGNYLFSASWVMMASMLLAAGILSIVEKAFPKWLGWFGIITAIGLIVAYGLWFGSSGIIFLPVTLFWIWLIGVSVSLFLSVKKEG